MLLPRNLSKVIWLIFPAKYFCFLVLIFFSWPRESFGQEARLSNVYKLPKAFGFHLKHVGVIHTDSTLSCALWRNFSQLILLRKDGVIEALDLLHYKKVRFKLPKAHHIALDPTDRYLAFASDKTVYIYDLLARQLLSQITADDAIIQLIFHPKNSALLILSSESLTLYAFKVELTYRVPLSIPRAPFLQAVFSCNGQRLATLAANNDLSMWNTEDKPILLKTVQPERKVKSMLFYDQDKNLLTTYLDKNQIDAWDISSLKRILSFPSRHLGSAFYFLPEHNRLLTFSPLLRSSKPSRTYLGVWTEDITYLGYLSGLDIQGISISKNESMLALISGKNIDILKIIWQDDHYRVARG